MRIKISTDFLISLCVFLFLVLIQLYFIFFVKDFQYYFASEYGNIAESLAKGKGFGNPFHAETGPTAWTTPLLVWIITLGFLVSGKTAITFIVLSILKFISLSIILFLILKIFDRLMIPKNYWIIVSTFLVFLIFSYNYLFFDLNDFWLSNLIITIFLYSIIGYKKNPRPGNLAGLYFSSLIIPLVNPSYAIGVLILISMYLLLPKLKSLFNYLLNHNKKRLTTEVLHPFGLIIIMVISFSMWTVRNYVVFMDFIPVKSNLWYEFYLANIVDGNGVVSRSSLYKSHPFLNQSVRNEMARKGEYKWLREFKALGADYLEKNPTDYIKNVSNRILNAFIFTENMLDLVQSEYLKGIDEVVSQKLLDHHLIFDDRWNHFHLKREEFEPKLKKLNIQHEDILIQDWLQAKQRYIRFKYSLPNILRGILIGFVPALCIILILFKNPLKVKIEVHYIVILYLIYLLPYILISHQIRYQRELFSLQIILISLTLSAFLTNPTNKSITND